MLSRMTKSTQNLNSCSFHLQVVLKKLQVPPPANPQKIYRCHVYVPLQRLHVPLMREPPEVLKSFFSTSDGSLIRYLFKSYKHNVQIALGKLEMPYPDSSKKTYRCDVWVGLKNLQVWCPGSRQKNREDSLKLLQNISNNRQHLLIPFWTICTEGYNMDSWTPVWLTPISAHLIRPFVCLFLLRQSPLTNTNQRQGCRQRAFFQ